MSYVPDYVSRGTRAERNSIISTALTNTTSSYTTSRPVTTNRYTSATMPAAVLTSPPNSSRDVTPTSPTHYYQRPQSKNTPHVGYREEYYRKREEKLCGKKSLKERLKSLELGADVKLQVSKGAQHRRRRSSDLLSVNDSNNSNKSQKTIPEPSLSATPDIIESHQPPAGNMHYNPTDTSKSENVFYMNNNEPRKNNLNDNYHSADKQYNNSIPTKNNPPIVKWHQEKKIEPIAIDEKNEDDIKNSNVEPQKMAVLKGEKQETNRNTETKLKWREPSIEALNRLHDIVEDQNNYNHENKNEVQLHAENNNEISPQPNQPPMQTPDPPPKRSVPPPLMLDVTTSQSVVVPVELRSPRSENKGFSRSNMREKRNARMFVMPSSDDSETDNSQFSKLNQDSVNRFVHVTPVKFVPSVLRRKKPPNPNPASSSSSYDSVSLPKVQEDVTKDTSPKKTVQPSKESLRSKKSSSRNQSSQMVNNHSETPDNKVKSPATRRSNSRRRNSTEKANNAHTPSKYNDEYAELSSKPRTPRTTRKFSSENLPSPRQVAVGQAVKFGHPVDEGEIPYIDGMHSPEQPKKSFADSPSHKSAASKHITRRGRSHRREHSPSRTTSYIEAIESSEDLTADTDGSINSGALNGSENIQSLPNISKFGRSNSADSVLSTTEELHKAVVMRKHKRSSSADRNQLKGVHRRSYQIATSPYSAAGSKPRQNAQHLTTPDSGFKRQRSIRKLKNFFGEASPQVVEAQEYKGVGRNAAPLPILDLSRQDDNVLREGFLYFKVATIEKGKRTSSQKLWKYVWVVLRDHFMYLCKDWLRLKQDATGDHSSLQPNPQHPHNPPLKHILEDVAPLDVQGSLVSIAYNYVKRRDVFRLTTSNGSEYLFQAESRDDMLAWINSIQFESNPDNDQINEDLILRKTNQIEAGPRPDKRSVRKSRSPKTPRQNSLAVKDVDGSRRFKWRGSVNRIVRKFGQGQTLMQGGTFDVHLEDCPISPNNEFVPFVVELCCRILEEKGLFFKGLYRVPGNSGTLAALQEELNIRGPDTVDLENDDRFSDVNVVSSLLKSFFRNLPDPLFTNELYDDFIATNRKKKTEERLNGLRRLIHMLPGPHYETLKFIITHLRKVADNAEVNMMDVRNLAIVFGPNLVRTTASDNMATMVTDMSDQCEIVQSVLQHASWYFPDENDKWVQETPVPMQHTSEQESVPSIDHLLVNVGRTRPIDNSDNASDSSKSKNSITSDKESFSRDVMDIIFGGKRRKAKQDKLMSEQESDDEFGFKEASLRAAVEQEAVKDPGTKYQVAKPAATEIRANWPTKEVPVDIPARLHQFYCEHLDKLSRKEDIRLPRFSSSSETSPHITPRTSKHEPYVPSSKPAFAPPSLQNVQYSPVVLHHPSLTTGNSVDKGEESDSDMSVYVGDTLEEKLKNLTNLDKKLERRPSQRHRQREPVLLSDYEHIMSKPPFSGNGSKRLTGPSRQAGMIITPDNIDYWPKKTTQELYQERKAQRKQLRGQTKHRVNTAKNRDARHGMTRCASHENIFQRSDPKRKAIPSGTLVDGQNPSVYLKPKGRASKERVHRRHTLGAGDFPEPDTWQNATDQRFVPQILTKKTESYL